MVNRKLILNNLLDIGGVATLSNFYSPTAKSYKGSLLFTRKLFASYLADGLIAKIPPIGRPKNKAQEVFYCLTKKGARYIGRVDEYKYKKYKRSLHNIMHESAVSDIALAFLRLYKPGVFSFAYHTSFHGLRPDITITIERSEPRALPRFLLVEFERKKTIDRLYNEKIVRYEQMFETMRHRQSHPVEQFVVLVVYADIWFNCFLRPQQYYGTNITAHIKHINYLTSNLASRYCHHLPYNRYRIMAFPDFYRLNESVWYSPGGRKECL